MNIQHHHHHGPKSTRRRTGKEIVLLATVCAAILITSLLLQQASSILSLHLLMTTTTTSRNENDMFATTGITSPSSLTSSLYQEKEEKYVYIASRAEQFLLENPSVYGFNTTGNQTSSACRLWRKENNANPLLHQQLQEYKGNMKEYAAAIEAFQPIGDLRLHLNTASSNSPNSHDFCKMVNLHADGIQGFFSNTTTSSSRLLSYSNAAGYMEPLLPPMRHPSFCRPDENGSDFGYLLDLSYLVHDFAALCRQLQRHSRIVLFDMGASLTFHRRGIQYEPMMQVINLFTKFGFPFDHIYAYEKQQTDAEVVFGERLPVQLMPAYHWINVGIVSEPGHRLNPFTTLLEKYNEDDIVLVKLDIDAPFIEAPLAHQVLADPRLAKIIDHFYFEHHVYMEELSYNWGGSMQGSIQDTLQLFHGLRQAGVAAHFWV